MCIVTDYCDAGDLYQLLRARKTGMPEAQLIELFVQVVLAIQYVHQKNILHRGAAAGCTHVGPPGAVSQGGPGRGEKGVAVADVHGRVAQRSSSTVWTRWVDL